MAYNIMSCAGFEQTGGELLTGCSMAWLAMALLFFIIVFARKGIEDGLGMEFSQPFGLIVGIGAFVIVVSIFGAVKWAMLAGIIGGIAGGFMFSSFGGSDY